MSDVTQVVVYTLTIGSIYGLVGYGYSLIFSTTRNNSARRVDVILAD